MDTNATLIETVLKQDSQDIEFEPIPEEDDSPLAQPVVQKSNTAGDVSAARQQTVKNENPEQTAKGTTNASPGETANHEKIQFDDAPEQEIDAEPTEEENQSTDGPQEEFSMPLEHARLMADSIIGTINNTVFEVGGGYFVKISKHKDFYDFEEIIQVIEEQNVKNTKRLKLDDEDKALLRPLLIQILRKKAAVMSPEKQLLMVTLSILIKKAKDVMEMRAENDALVERIRDVIRKEVRAAKDEQEQQDQEQRKETDAHNRNDLGAKTNSEYTETVYEEVVDPGHGKYQTGLPDEVVEHY